MYICMYIDILYKYICINAPLIRHSAVLVYFGLERILVAVHSPVHLLPRLCPAGTLAAAVPDFQITKQLSTANSPKCMASIAADYPTRPAHATPNSCPTLAAVALICYRANSKRPNLHNYLSRPVGIPMRCDPRSGCSI